MTPALSTKVSHLFMLIIIVILFLHTKDLHRKNPHYISPARKDAALLATNVATTPEEQYLERLKREHRLTSETIWTTWRVKPFGRTSEDDSITEVKTAFGRNRGEIINIRNPDRSRLHASKELSIPIHESPSPAQVDASDLFFGVSTTYARVAADDFALVKAWSRWLTDGEERSNGASLLLVLDQASDDQVSKVDDILENHGIDAYVSTFTVPMSYARRYFELVRIMKTFSATLAKDGQNKRWFGLLDDHIFLPNLFYLKDRLYTYHSDQELYIGLPSERSDWEVGKGALKTSGGGAVFFTQSAVSHIARLPCFRGDDTSLAFRAKKWDSLLQDCIMTHTDLTMRVIPSFYSPSDNDEYARRADSYETGIRPLTLHHSQERHGLDPSTSHLVSQACGGACFLQRYHFLDDWVLINGYSITEYPSGFDVGDAFTYVDADGLHSKKKSRRKRGMSVAPRMLVDEDTIERRMLTWRGRRNVWRLMDSVVGEDGAVWQAYVKKGSKKVGFSYASESKSVGGDWRDSVIVMIWDKGDAPKPSAL